jgi:hypothetical protein
VWWQQRLSQLQSEGKEKPMGDYAGHQRPGDTVPHQDEQEALIDDQLEATSDHAAIADLASPGASYVQAEAVAARDKINEILDVLRDAGLIPTS